MYLRINVHCLGNPQSYATAAPALPPSNYASGSCLGRCGGESGGCYCDSICNKPEYQDCCPDKFDHCPVTTRTPQHTAVVRDFFHTEESLPFQDLSPNRQARPKIPLRQNHDEDKD
jgi:hypothetical protein